jgi:hypothetical protein
MYTCTISDSICLVDNIPRFEELQSALRHDAKKRFDDILNVDYSWPQNHKETNCDIIEDIVNDGDFVVVIGGGYGISSVVAATEVGPTGEVLIYEGAEEVIKELSDTLSINGVNKQTSINHAVVGKAEDLKSPPGDAVTIQPDDIPPCDVLEMDCEGAEIDIIPELSDEINTIIVETHPLKGAPTSEVKKILEERGWQIAESSPDRRSGDVLMAR